MPSYSACPKCVQRVTVPDNLDESAMVRCPRCKADYPADEVMELTADEIGDSAGELMPVDVKSDGESSDGESSDGESDDEDREPSPEPESADQDSGPLVKCPCCDAEFGLAKVIVAATGEELGSEAAGTIGPDGSVISTAADSGSLPSFGPPGGDHASYGIAIDTGDEDTPKPAAAFDFQDGNADHRDAALASMASAAGTRRHRDSGKHPLRLMIEIVLGGVAGLAITYYGLNFFGGERFAYFDVYLPGVKHTAEHQPVWWPGASGQADSDESGEEPDVARLEQSGPPEEVSAPPLPVMEVPPEELVMETPVPVEEPSPEPPEVLPPLPPPPTVGPADPPSFTSDELGKVLKTTHTAFTANALTEETYRELCQLAQAVTFVELDDASPQLRNRLEAVDILLNKIGREESNLAKIGEMAAGLAYDQERAGDGILLAGTVESALKLGQAHGVGVQLSGTDSPLVVLSKTPMPAEVGERVLVLGSIVDKPGENMVGVETSMRRAVWSRMTVNLGE